MRGFTLIELVMVIVIVGILAIITVPRFESFYAIKLDGATKKVVSDIRYVQQLAVSLHENYEIIFDIDPNNKYEVRRVLDNSFAKDPFTRADFIVNFNTDAQYKGINIQNNATFQFDWQGSTAGGSVSLGYRGRVRTITVEANTGRVSVE